MNYSEELKVIKPRDLTVDLSTKDIELLSKIAAINDMTVNEFMRELINDVIDNDYAIRRSGRCIDEWFFQRDYKRFYFDENETLLKFLISNDYDVDMFATMYEELQYATLHREEFDDGDIKYYKNELIKMWSEYKDDLKYSQSYIKDRASVDINSLDFNNEMKPVVKWARNFEMLSATVISEESYKTDFSHINILLDDESYEVHQESKKQELHTNPSSGLNEPTHNELLLQERESIIKKLEVMKKIAVDINIQADKKIVANTNNKDCR